jgi:EAL domain-containing protein (putative c-di-GMP-specific phosphodiesterase class I)
MAVNVSALQFAQPDFVEAVNSALRRSGLDGACLELELTESLLMQQTQQSVEKLEQLRGLGVRIAVDDFGTGYSSLAYLHRLPIDTLKIDRSFVQEISRGPEGVRRKDAIVRAIASLAHSLELKVVAEGVETEPQRQFLQSLACDAMQGFLFGHPQPASAFDALLGATSRPTLSPQDSATPPESGALTLTAEASTV